MNPIYRILRTCKPAFFSWLAAVCVGILLGATPAWAQSASTGTVSGQVVDQLKAAVPGADVTLLDVATNAKRTALTNEAGRYIFVSVPPGTYDISVSMTGFQTAKVSTQKVTVGQELTIDLTMTVGGVTETIEVLASAASQLQTTSATVGTTIAGDSILLLPNFSRDAYALQTLSVGVTSGGQVAGVQSDQNTYIVDGANVTDDNSGNASYNPLAGLSSISTGVLPTPVESVEEFKMGTSNQTADFANSAGSQVQMVTKRGTGRLHGSLYEYYYGSNVGAANTWRNNRTPDARSGLPYTPLPSSHYNRFGATAGGPVIPKDFLGGKWFLFGNYEGYRYPNATTVVKVVPTELMRAGVIQVQNAAGKYVPYNLNPYPVTLKGITYQPATCGPSNAPCDPRGLGLNPIVKQLWEKYMPLPNDPQSGDTANTQGYLTPIKLPERSNTFVARLDHDFGPMWHFMSSYRYYKYNAYGSDQYDIGGLLPGCKFGEACSVYTTPSQPWSMVFGLTTTLTNHLTNDVRFSYVRNLWAYASAMAPPQLPGLAGAIEIGGETANALIPYNVNNQSVRAREWNGQDKAIRDDLSYLKGNHLFQFGGSYQRNLNQMYRTDNGAGIMSALVYQIYDTGIQFTSAYQPAGLPSSSLTPWNRLYAQVLGLVNQPQALFTRKLPDLTLNPVGTPMFPRAIIPFYNAYFTDTWHLRPKLTLTYGLGYMLERPPYELSGQQVITVDPDNKPLSVPAYLEAKKKAALAGQVYNPVIGMTLVRNVAGGLKYPYKDFWGGLSPRVGLAWNPSFGGGILGKLFGNGETVFRGGYSRSYGRLNGVKLVMSLVNNTGVGQPISCVGASIDGRCLGNLGVDPKTAFRIGTDGMAAPMPTLTKTLPQPYFPGVGANPAAGEGAGIDPEFKPNRSDQLTVSIQRALSKKLTLEVGYIGRIIRDEFLPINLDAVPYMLSLGGQSFDKAWASLYVAVRDGQTVQPQPWFEAAMGGASSAYCKAYPSCTAAVAAKQSSYIKGTRVYSVWAALQRDSSWTLGRTQPSSNPAQVTSLIQYTSLGFGNYNAGYVTFTARDWHGLGARSNFTWGRSLGTGFRNQSGTGNTVLDQWDIHASYGPQLYDNRFIYNLAMTYQPEFYRNRSGFLGRVLGGWSIAPLFTAESGAPLRVNTSSGNLETFGQGMAANTENAVLIAPYSAGNSAHRNVTVPSGAGINGNPDRGGSGINMFADPNAVYAQFRRLILGIDHGGNGTGVLRGFPTWNLDMTVAKEFRVMEQVGATLMFQFTNILNHFQPSNPAVNIDSPASFGVVTGQANTPRRIQFGLRIRF